MISVGIADISKNPSIFKKEDLFEIIDKKSDTVKGLFISNEYRELFKDIVEEIEFQRFVKRNSGLLKNESLEIEEVVEDGLDEI